MAVAPEPWLRWQQASSGQATPKVVPESLGLYRNRLHPSSAATGEDVWWEVTDEQTAFEAAQDMLLVLEGHGWALLDRLLTPDGMLHQIRSGDLGHVRKWPGWEGLFASAEAVMLMDNGLGPLREEHLDVEMSDVEPAQAESARRFDEWVREQARRADDRASRHP